MEDSKVNMVGLSRVVHNELKRIKDFSIWYRRQNEINPENFPLCFPENNAGVWDEMMADFDTSLKVYQDDN